MEITWLGQACFRIRSTHGIVITDPYNPEMGYVMGKQTARLVTVSHQHPDHAYTQAITGDFRVIDRPGEYEVSNILVIGIPTFHDSEQGKVHGKNIAYLIEADDISICHLGDLGHLLSTQQVEDLEPVDILLLPVGGQATINAKQAAEIVRQLEPKVVIPMHYKTPEMKAGPFELDTVDPFLAEIGHSGIVPQPKLSITKSTLPEAMQVVVLDYPHPATTTP
jgi:L-ascorbate metabolism protein UlaG (beta-lactamase superfamily)